MPMMEFIAEGCPMIDRTEHVCSQFHRYQFAAIGYLVLKIVSQLVHILNLWNAVRVIRTNLKADRATWHRQKQTQMSRLNSLGLNCRRQQ